jgi:hypothetical protein
MIRVRIYIAFYRRAITIALPDDVQPVEQLIPALRNKLTLPWLKYTLSFPEKKGRVPPKKTLRELGIHNDDTLVFDIERPEAPEPEEESPQTEAQEEPARLPAKNGMPLWLTIFIIFFLVALCVTFLIILRNWEIYS